MLWRQLFQNHILDRGLDYFNDGRVNHMRVGECFIDAIVHGCEKYEVHIDLEDGEVDEMLCSCPSAEGGVNCKHMAAVLFTMEGNIKSNEGTTVKVSDLVNGADEFFVRSFLTELLENDVKLQKRFRGLINGDASPAELKRCKNQIDRIVEKYSGRSNFIAYYQSGQFIGELEEILDEDVQSMISRNQLAEAMELTNYIFLKAGSQDLDDSDDETDILSGRCTEIWRVILSSCSQALKRDMFYWLCKHLDQSLIESMEQYIEDILFEDFSEREFLEQKLSFTEKKVSEYKKEKDSWSREYHTGQWAVKHIVVMQQLGETQNSIDEYCIQNLNYDMVRKFFVEDCIKRNKYDIAIRTLEEGKALSRKYPGLEADYSMRLKDLYRQAGNQEAYEKELWYLILGYRACDLKLFKELKSLYSKEMWEKKREDIFEKSSDRAGIDKLYAEEKLYDRLLKIVLCSAGLYKVSEYEKYLKKTYHKELLQKYELELNRMAGHTTDRKRYREIVAILKKVQKYPEGKKKSDEIVADWKSKYKNRSAMMDELRKL